MNKDFNTHNSGSTRSIGRKNPYVNARKEMALARKSHVNASVAFVASLLGASMALVWISVQTLVA